VNLGPLRLAKALGLVIVPHTDGRRIGTADAEGHMDIEGWVFPRGYTGPIALVRKAAYTLLSVIQLQQHGMGVHCPPERPICVLTVIKNDEEIVYDELQQSPPTNLYFINIYKLMSGYRPECVPQAGDAKGPGIVWGGNAGIIELSQDAGSAQVLRPGSQDRAGGTTVGVYVRPSQSLVPKRKKTPTADIVFRVWSLHER